MVERLSVFPKSTLVNIKPLPVSSLLSVACTGPQGENTGSNPPGGGGVLPMMTYTGRLRPKGVYFSGLTYMKG